MNTIKTAQEILDGQSDLIQSISKVYDDCFKLKNQERVLILSDRFRSELGQKFYDVAHTRTTTPVLTIIEKGEEHIPKEFLEHIVEMFDVVIMLGNISYSNLRKKAEKLGKRVATLPHVTEDVLKKLVHINLSELQKDAEILASKLRNVKTIRVTSPAGTDVTLDVKGQRVFKNDGDLTQPGAYQNIPPGEVYLSPKTAQGIVVIDGSFPLCGLMKSPLKYVVEQGHVIGFETQDHELAEKLDEKFLKHKYDAGNIAELGIGISKVASLVGVTLEDEKTLGTVHIAIGANAFMGGSVDISMHLDGVIKSPSLFLDNKPL